MIDFFFGKPRSGKSYRAVKYIFDEYFINETPKYRNILTNIGGFKFDKVNQMFLDKGSSCRAYKLVWKDFYKHLKVMYEMALDDKCDDELNKYANYHLINDCLIVLDEASLYMKKYDDVISWWLAYHGHFKIQIIIIAQGPKQINIEYMTHTEIFYVAQPQTKQLSDNQLRYIHYSDSIFNKDTKFSSSTIKTNPDIYDLYKSGEVDKPKKIIFKYIFIFFLGLLFAVFLFYKLFSSVGGNSVPVDINTVENLHNIDSNNTDLYFDISSDLINIRCNKKYCWNTNPIYLSNEVTLTYLKFVLLKNDINLAYSEIKNEVFKLTPQKLGQSKSTISNLTDYYYFIPVEIQKSYLSTLFVLKKPKKEVRAPLDIGLGLNQSSNKIKNEADD